MTAQRSHNEGDQPPSPRPRTDAGYAAGGVTAAQRSHNEGDQPPSPRPRTDAGYAAGGVTAAQRSHNEGDQPPSPRPRTDAGYAARRVITERRPTIHDVAQAAGVSAMSVSRVLNGRPGVGARTARRIEEAVRALGYRPNMLATNFRQRRGVSLIGMIVPDPYTPLFTSIAVAVGELVRGEGLIVVTASSGGDAARERALVSSFIERGIDGILLFSEDHDHSYLEPELERGRPMVFLGSPPVGVVCPTVLVDNRGGAGDAVAHLLRHGHRRIGIVTKPASFPAAERLAGYREAVARHGIDADPSLVHLVANVAEPGRRAVEALLARPDPPTAVFSTNYLLTAAMLGPLRAVEPAVALVAFDDFEAALLVDPPISVVTQDPPAMAAHAARMLLAQMDGSGDRAAVSVVPPRLVPRGSGELPPAPGLRYR